MNKFLDIDYIINNMKEEWGITFEVQTKNDLITYYYTLGNWWKEILEEDEIVIDESQVIEEMEYYINNAEPISVNSQGCVLRLT